MNPKYKTWNRVRQFRINTRVFELYAKGLELQCMYNLREYGPRKKFATASAMAEFLRRFECKTGTPSLYSILYELKPTGEENESI